MFHPILRVELEFAPNDVRRVHLELTEEIVHAAREILDLPSPRADAFGRYLCSSEYTIKRVMKERGRIAEILSAAITRALLDALGAKDMEMGYEKKGGRDEDYQSQGWWE
ncbi:MAG: hypothetical protein AB1585_10695 [Thermodesulfobacteriota bacterium]